MQRLHWMLRDRDENENENENEKPIRKTKDYESYMESVNLWNMNLRQISSKLRIIFKKNLGNKFFSKNDQGSSIHSLFAKAHKSTQNWIDCNSLNCDRKSHEIETSQAFDMLGAYIELYINAAYNEYIEAQCFRLQQGFYQSNCLTPSNQLVIPKIIRHGNAKGRIAVHPSQPTTQKKIDLH